MKYSIPRNRKQSKFASSAVVRLIRLLRKGLWCTYASGENFLWRAKAKAINFSAGKRGRSRKIPSTVQPSPSSAISTCSSPKPRQTSLYCVLSLCSYLPPSVPGCERTTTSSFCVSIRDPARIQLPLHDRYPHFNHNNQRPSAEPGYGVIVILLGSWWSQNLGVYHALVVPCQGRVRPNQERGWSEPEGFYKISESRKGAPSTQHTTWIRRRGLPSVALSQHKRSVPTTLKITLQLGPRVPLARIQNTDSLVSKDDLFDLGARWSR